MRRFYIVFLTLFSLAIAPIAKAQSDEIRGVISAQIDAFQSNDLERAFSFASPMIKQIFQNPTRFGQMVQNGYPMVWRPADMRFGGLSLIEDTQIQTVYFTDAQGQVFEAVYEMLETEDGWQINGVSIRQADLGA